MKHTVTALVGGKPLRGPHVYTPLQDPGRRPFEDYQNQPDTAERMRLAVQAIPFALPEKKANGRD